MLALTTEGLIVVCFGGLILLVCLGLFVVRGTADSDATAEARLVKVSAPASLIGVLIGALLVLVGTDFIRLGAPDDSGFEAASSPPTLLTTTTPSSSPAPPPSIADSFDGLPPTSGPPGSLAYTGSPTLTLAGVGLMFTSGGAGLLLSTKRKQTPDE